MKRNKNVNRGRQEIIANFEKELPLKRSEVNCIVCVSILVDPVTFPCKHSICLQCFNRFIRETSLNCPLCRLRLSIWSRKAIKENTLVNTLFKERLENQFPNEIALRKRETEAMGNTSEPFDASMFEDPMDSMNDIDDGVKQDVKIAEPGEMAMDLDLIYKAHQEEFDKQRFEAEQASQALVSQLVEEDPLLSRMTQVESDFKLAQELFKAEQDDLHPVLRSQRSQEALRSQLITPLNSVSKFKNKTTPSAASRVISKTTRRRQSAPTKKNTTKKLLTTGGTSTPNRGKEKTKQANIASFFTKSPVPVQTLPQWKSVQSAAFATPTSLSSSQTTLNFGSESYTCSAESQAAVLSPSVIFADLSINTPPPEPTNLEEVKCEDLENLDDYNVDNNFLRDSTFNNDDFLFDVNAEKSENENKLPGPKTELIPLALSQLSSISSEKGSVADSQLSLDLGPIADRYREEEIFLEEYRKRLRQEEEDRKMALRLQEIYSNGNHPRGRFATKEQEKYFIRNWAKQQSSTN